MSLRGGGGYRPVGGGPGLNLGGVSCRPEGRSSSAKVLFRPEGRYKGVLGRHATLGWFEFFVADLLHQALELALLQADSMLSVARLFSVTCQYGIQQNSLPSLVSRTTRKG